ncbi:MAG: family 16 glycoside hydrolase [Planctomycetaceae bacterium]
MNGVPRAALLGAAWLAAGLVLAADPPAPTLSAETLLDASRVLVLGDSITHDGRWLAHVVAWMEDRGTAAEVIDCGLSAETVSGLSEDGHAGGRFPRPDLAERLDRVLRLVRPDVVVACYGMNCGIYQPLDEERFTAFRRGMERLHAAVGRTGARIVHLTPPPYGGPPGVAGPAGAVDYDAVLTAYARWLVEKREDGWLVIDVHGPLREALAERRRTDPAFAFAADAVHPDDEGHLEIARAVLAGLGDGRAATAADLPQRLAPFMPEVTARLRVLRDAYLAAAGHLRPGVPAGLPVAAAEAEARALTASIRGRRLQLRGRALPSGEWRMAIEWPRPAVVDPGPEPAGPAAVPADAVVLFDGTSLYAWRRGDAWTVADGVATVGKGAIETRDGFGDCHLHVEFRTVAPARGRGQGRSNSGVFLMGRYEIQVLDSFADGSDGPLTYPDGQCGALYKQRPPAVNACRPPGAWQTYDILFTRPRFRADGALEAPGRVSMLHNGVAIHSDTVILGSTFWHQPPAYEAHADALPIMLQDHGDPVQFRSIWVRRFEPPVPQATAND